MKVIVYTVAPLIHYAPFYAALAELKRSLQWDVTIRNCRTDRTVIERLRDAYRVSSELEDTIVLALTSTTDLGSCKSRVRAARNLKLLLPLLPRVPLWYVCATAREDEMRARIKELASITPQNNQPQQKLKIACYAKNTTSYWVVSKSFRKDTIYFCRPPLSFSNDKVSQAAFKRGSIDLAVSLHPWRYRGPRQFFSFLDGPPVSPFGFTGVLIHKRALERSELRDALRQIRDGICTQLIELYKIFELDGFDWRRHSGHNLRTDQEYIKCFLAGLDDLNVRLPKHYSQSDLASGFRDLVSARVWTLPESALEEIAGSTDPMETYGTIIETWADGFTISETSAEWLRGTLKRIQNAANEITKDARIAAEPVSNLTERRQLLRALRHVELEFHAFQPSSGDAKDMPLILKNAIPLNLKRTFSVPLEGESLKHLFQNYPDDLKARDQFVDRINDQLLARLRKLREQEEFLEHIAMVMDFFTPKCFGRGGARMRWWPLLYHPSVKDYWRHYLKKHLRVPNVILQPFNEGDPKFIPFFAYAAQALFITQRGARNASRSPPPLMTINIQTTSIKATFTAKWKCKKRSLDYTFNRADPKLSRITTNFEGRLWFLDELFLRARCRTRTSSSNEVAVTIELIHDEKD